MNKKSGIIKLVALLAVIAFIVYTAAFGLGKDASGSMNDISLGLDLRGGVSITYEAQGDDVSSQDMEDTKYKLEQRVQDYSTEAQVYFEGDRRITIDIPGATDANEVLEEIGKPGKLIFCTDSSDPEGTMVIDGNNVVDAQPVVSTENGREYLVQLTLDSAGQEAFSEATGELYQTKGIIYVMYNDEILSSPRVQAHITSDTCTISGMADYDEADKLASNIRSGALSVELVEMRSQVVGAKLGQDAVRTSLLAGVIGLIIIFIFMIVYYRLPGFAASIALIMYTGLVVVLLSAFKEEITLTLPGIAGIILGIGMAVDANCIIFSRIREEIGSGKTVRNAIDLGFSKAFSAILDGNVTTLIAAAVLYFLGSGTVRGFAQTLALGIVVSMFTALTITKTLLRCFYAIGLQDEKLYGKTTGVKVFDYIGHRKLFYSISGAVIAIGLIAMIIFTAKGSTFNYSLDFVGGASTSITFNEEYSIEELEEKVQPLVSEVTGDNDIQMTPVSGSNEVIIKTRTLTVDERDELYTKLADEFGVDESTIQTENISASVSSQMKSSAVWSVIVSAVFMLIYVWIRFKDLSFGAAAVMPLMHDVLVLLTFYVLFRWTVGNTFIACMLTLVGYSINATIVIFDRIREELKSGMDRKELVNLAVSETLSRSINTSLTTLIMVVVLYILGVTSIKEFALPLIVGIICGCYSSVCIAGALWYDIKNAMEKHKAKKEAEAKLTGSTKKSRSK